MILAIHFTGAAMLAVSVACVGDSNLVVNLGALAAAVLGALASCEWAMFFAGREM